MKFKVQKFDLTNTNSLKHSKAVTSIGWINSDEILSIGDDHQILRWNVTSGKAQNISINYSSNIININEKFFSTSLQLAPNFEQNNNGNFNFTANNNTLALIGTTDGKVFLMNINGKVEKIVDAHKGATLNAKWCKDSLGFITSGEDGSVKIWSKSGMLRSILVQNGRAVYALDWNINGTKVVYSVGEDCFIKSLKAHNNLIKWRAHQNLVLCMAWSTNTNLIVTGGEDCRYRIWDDLGRPLYSSYEHSFPITSILWNSTGKLLAVGSYNLLRLCDKAGWSHSVEKPSTGSIYSMCWSLDGTQLVAGCADGTLLHAHVIEKRLIWENIEAIQIKRKVIEVKDLTADISLEKLETRDRIIKLQIGYNYLIVVTTKQCYIYSAKTWNTPVIIDLKNGAFSSNSVSLIILCEKYFLLSDNLNTIQIFNYEGQIQCTVRLSTTTNGNFNSSNEALNEQTVGLSNDVFVFCERFQPSSIKFFDVLNGNSIGDLKLTHSCDIVELAINQSGSISERRVAFIDINLECYLTRINSYTAIQRIEKIGSQVSDLLFNDTSNMLTAFQGKNLFVWTFPSIVFIDNNLLPQTNINIGTVERLSKSASIVGFIGNKITVRRSDGCLLVFYLSPFISGILRCVYTRKWDQAIKICRIAKEGYLWATLAGLAAEQNNYAVSEICYGQLNETEKVLFLNEISVESNTHIRSALMSLFNGNEREADTALIQNSEYFRAIMLNLSLFNFDRALEIALKSQTHLDTVLGYRLRYLEQTGRRENDSKFLKYLSQVEIDWPHICEKIRQDRAKFK